LDGLGDADDVAFAQAQGAQSALGNIRQNCFVDLVPLKGRSIARAIVYIAPRI